jgi:hypothetical protein
MSDFLFSVYLGTSAVSFFWGGYLMGRAVEIGEAASLMGLTGLGVAICVGGGLAIAASLIFSDQRKRANHNV